LFILTTFFLFVVSYIFLTNKGNQTAAPAPAVPSSGDKKAAAPAKKASAPAADDFDDMFGGGDDEELNEEGETAAEAAATKARQARMEAARKLKEEKDAKDGKVKSTKEKPVEKSLLVLEVKPWEADTDLEKVWHMIKEYKQDGLAWGETFKLEPVAYGIKKLVMTCTIVDSMVLMDDITENIEALEEHVQSCTVASMNKI
jgi:translation elongation factor EF-1beta